MRGLKISCVAMLERPNNLADFSCEHGFDEVNEMASMLDDVIFLFKLQG
jgi:hypothetical protein